ncbi:MAG TPA: hypothetical protein VMT91_09475 [Anaerolineales bacterium]|nr:hypothetical protein [Anaerolineales bacterium]
MLGYQRTSRICPADTIHSALFQAVQGYFQSHQLGDPATETRLCCETIATRSDQGRLVGWLDGNPDMNIHLAILLTGEWLIWARSGDQTGTVITGTKLQVIKAKAFVRRHTKDMELEISGFLADNKEYVRGSLELGSEPAAQKFCEAVLEAVQKAIPPSRKRFFGLIDR